MSYILDALRRAESERARERAEVPGLHSRQFPENASEGVASATGGVPWRWVVLSLGAGVLLPLMSWWMLSDDPASRTDQRVAAQDTPAAAAVSSPVEPAASRGAAAAGPASPLVAPPPRDALVLPADPAPVPAPSAARAPAPVATPASASVRPPAVASTAAPTVPPSVPPSMPPTAQSPARSAGPVLSLEEMPAEIRRELPSLQVGGSVYSDDPGSRLLILNGQLFHERDQIQTGLVLEQIRAKSAILNFKGYRYQISY